MHGMPGKFIGTDILRASATQELQRVIHPLGDGGSLVRAVQIVVPLGEVLFAVVDAHDAEDEADHLSNKSFNWPPLAPGQTIKFLLGPKQSLSLCSNKGVIILSIITETYEPV